MKKLNFRIGKIASKNLALFIVLSFLWVDCAAVNSNQCVNNDIKKQSFNNPSTNLEEINSPGDRKIKKKRFKIWKKLVFLTSNKNPDKREIYPLAKFSALAGLGGLAILLTVQYIGIFGLLLAALLGYYAIPLGFIALRTIKESNEKYKGKNLAIVGILLGLIPVLWLTYLIYSIPIGFI